MPDVIWSSSNLIGILFNFSNNLLISALLTLPGSLFLRLVYYFPNGVQGEHALHSLGHSKSSKMSVTVDVSVPPVWIFPSFCVLLCLFVLITFWSQCFLMTVCGQQPLSDFSSPAAWLKWQPALHLMWYFLCHFLCPVFKNKGGYSFCCWSFLFLDIS